MDDLCEWSLTEAATALTRGLCSAVELTSAVLARIERLDTRLQAYACLDVEHAMASAREADRRRAAGETTSPMCGIPLGLKDIIAAAGMPTDVGSVALRNWGNRGDSTVAERLRAAGAVIIGKHRTTEGACGAHHPSLPVPLNPWHADAWTGVSSSGSAVAVAAGLAFGSFGSDTGGSIRFPAHCCGLVGLKPGWGRISVHGVYPLAPSLDHVGPIARRVNDVALLYAAVAGQDRRDSASLQFAVPSWDAERSCVRGLTVGFDEVYASDGVAAPITDALHHAAQALVDAGARLVPVQVPRLGDTVHAWLQLCAAEAATAHAATYPAKRNDYGPALRALLDWGCNLEVSTLASARAARAAFCDRYDALFDAVDLFLSPTFDNFTPSIAEVSTMMRGEGLRRFVAFTAPGNLYGCPTLSLPSALDPRGVPFGIQLVARKGAENALFDAGLACERASAWAGLPTAGGNAD